MSGLDFDGWSLPGKAWTGTAPEVVGASDGLPFRRLHLSPEHVREVADQLREARESLLRRPAMEIAAVLGKVGARFLDPDDPLRRRALELLPPTSGLSMEMATAVLDGMARDWTSERLKRLLEAELSDPAALDRFVAEPTGRVRAVGPSLTTQIVSGSVPGVGATAVLRSLLVKSPTLIKPGRGDVVLPALLGGAIADADPALGAAVAVLYWQGGEGALEREAMAQAEVVVVYGSDDTVGRLREVTPVTTSFVPYRHRIGVGLICREALDRGEELARLVAEAVSMFDQRGCVSPHVVHVEEGGALTPGAFAELLAEGLRKVESKLPGGVLDPSEASRLQQVRGAVELSAHAGSGRALAHGGSASWTVVYDPTNEPVELCVGRVVTVRPEEDIGGTAALLGRVAARLQTVAVAGSEDRIAELAETLAEAGVTRITGFDTVSFPPAWWHHDGRGPLAALLRWVDLESSGGEVSPGS